MGLLCLLYYLGVDIHSGEQYWHDFGSDNLVTCGRSVSIAMVDVTPVKLSVVLNPMEDIDKLH